MQLSYITLHLMYTISLYAEWTLCYYIYEDKQTIIRVGLPTKYT